VTDTPSSIWLVGLSGAGKSTVGPLVAERLGYDFVDLDTRVAELAGETISALFRAGGEPSFRRFEAAATSETRGLGRTVVATGGGWMARKDLERTWDGCTRVWLRVGAETAIHRLGRFAPGERPLLDGPDPSASLAGLLREREGAYSEAELTVDTEGRSPDEVAKEVVRKLETAGARSVGKQEIEKS